MNYKCYMIEPVPGAEEQNLWRRLDTGEVKEMRDMPPGAMWYCPWLLQFGASEYFDALPDEVKKKGHLCVK
jgi:hypothetical protein